MAAPIHVPQPIRRTTLCYLFRINNAVKEVLLAMKKRGFGKGKWNGPGGKVQSGETLTEAAIRECREESGLIPLNLQHRGIIEFIYENNAEWNNRCHIFTGDAFSGTLQETEEMKPEWFPVDNIPYSEMWEDDKIWIPELLAGKNMAYRFYFDGDRLLRYEPLPDMASLLVHDSHL